MANPVRPTTLISSSYLNDITSAEVILASETFQVTGSFKFRAAYNLAATVPNRHIVASSSGNFGQALACACKMLGKRCTIVMPMTSAKVKIAAVEGYGAQVRLIDTATQSRAQTVQEIVDADPDAYASNAYDDAHIIAGNASLGREIARLSPRPDVVIVPVGGGGLSSGIITGLEELGAKTQVVGAEPMLGNKVTRSFRADQLIANAAEPMTVADGARTISLGKLNWPILQRGMRWIVEVSEDQIREGVRMLFRHANLKVEPTGALAVAALLSVATSSALPIFKHKRVCCVVSGGNVDPATYAEIITDVLTGQPK